MEAMSGVTSDSGCAFDVADVIVIHLIITGCVNIKKF